MSTLNVRFEKSKRVQNITYHSPFDIQPSLLSQSVPMKEMRI